MGGQTTFQDILYYYLRIPLGQVLSYSYVYEDRSKSGTVKLAPIQNKNKRVFKTLFRTLEIERFDRLGQLSVVAFQLIGLKSKFTSPLLELFSPKHVVLQGPINEYFRSNFPFYPPSILIMLIFTKQLNSLLTVEQSMYSMLPHPS